MTRLEEQVASLEMQLGTAKCGLSVGPTSKPWDQKDGPKPHAGLSASEAKTTEHVTVKMEGLDFRDIGNSGTDTSQYSSAGVLRSPQAVNTLSMLTRSSLPRLSSVESDVRAASGKSSLVVLQRMEKLNQLPDSETVSRLFEYYCRHSHSLYPVLNVPAFFDFLNAVYDTTDGGGPEILERYADEVWLVRYWIILAIASTTLSCVQMSDDTPASHFFAKAMEYVDPILARNDLDSLEIMIYFSLYSFFNSRGPDSWLLVGQSIRLSLELRLHLRPTLGAENMQKLAIVERRKRLFWSVYMMDRMVSTIRGRPLGIRDEDIDIEFPSQSDYDEIPNWKIGKVPSIEVPLHIIRLRHISGRILQDLYTPQNKNLDDNAKMILVRNLHQLLVAWRKSMPFPLEELKNLYIPHLTTAWFDLNYYNMVIMLYRPSQMFPNPSPEAIVELLEASLMSTKLSLSMVEQYRMSFNWLNYVWVFMSSVTLLYCISNAQRLKEPIDMERAWHGLQGCSTLLSRFCERFVLSKKCVDIFNKLASRIAGLEVLQPSSTPERIPDAKAPTDLASCEDEEMQIPISDLFETLCKQALGQGEREGPTFGRRREELLFRSNEWMDSIGANFQFSIEMFCDIVSVFQREMLDQETTIGTNQ